MHVEFTYLVYLNASLYFIGSVEYPVIHMFMQHGNRGTGCISVRGDNVGEPIIEVQMYHGYWRIG